MKYFILIFIGLITLVIITSCGLIQTTKIDKEVSKFSKEYSGIYVFDKKLRDEIKQRDKEREEYIKSRLETIEMEKEKLLRTFFTEKEIQDYRDMIESDRKRGSYNSYSWHPIQKKANEILKELYKKYPYSSIDEKFPAILSNGCKYYTRVPPQQQEEENDWSSYHQKIKEYMGDEVYNKLKYTLRVSSYYVDKSGKVIPITMYTFIYVHQTAYGLYGDEGAGFRLTREESYDISKGIIFYFINGKFIKSDERGKGARY